MSRARDFLARWARQKRNAAVEPVAKCESPKDAESGMPPEASAAESAAVPLPPIETIDAATDLAPFLAPGVSAELARAALRRAWSADPAIRDFIGLSENSWDFNVPSGVPGFGALSKEDVRRLAAELFRQSDAAATEPAAPSPGTLPPAEPKSDPAPQPSNVALQHEQDQEKPGPSHSNPRHGGALPQ